MRTMCDMWDMFLATGLDWQTQKCWLHYSRSRIGQLLHISSEQFQKKDNSIDKQSVLMEKILWTFLLVQQECPKNGSKKSIRILCFNTGSVLCTGVLMDCPKWLFLVIYWLLIFIQKSSIPLTLRQPTALPYHIIPQLAWLVLDRLIIWQCSNWW